MEFLESSRECFEIEGKGRRGFKGELSAFVGDLLRNKTLEEDQQKMDFMKGRFLLFPKPRIFSLRGAIGSITVSNSSR